MSSLQSYIGQILFVRVNVLRNLTSSSLSYVLSVLETAETLADLRIWHERTILEDEIHTAAHLNEMCERVFTQIVILYDVFSQLRQSNTTEKLRENLADALLVVSKALKCFEVVAKDQHLRASGPARTLALQYLTKVMSLCILVTKMALGSEDEITQWWEEDLRVSGLVDFRFDSRETYSESQIPDPSLGTVIIPAHSTPARLAMGASQAPSVYVTNQDGQQQVSKKAAVPQSRDATMNFRDLNLGDEVE